MSAESLHGRFRECARLIADTGRELALRGWTPATSSNLSARVSPDRAAITISGRDKGRLGEDDIMLVDLEGRAVGTDARPSAETLLHTQIYRRYPDIGAVLHVHSHNATVMSKLCADDGELRLEGYELLKAFEGFATHHSVLVLPVFANTQDMDELAGEVDAYLDAGHRAHGYLIEGHGIYTWGRQLHDARRHLEAFEFLLACELELRRLRP